MRSRGSRANTPLNGLWAAICVPSFLIVFVLMWYVLVGNAPVWDMHNSGVGTVTKASWLVTVNETSRGGGSGGSGTGLRIFAFGVWGWCDWSDTSSSEAGLANCYGGGIWSIPKNAPDGDPVLSLDLPS